MSLGTKSLQERAKMDYATDRLWAWQVGNPNLGTVLYVGSAHPRSSDTKASGTHRTQPLASLAEAFSRVDDNDGTVIHVLPGHTETCADATSLIMSYDNVSILGQGRGSAMPKITFTTATTAMLTLSGDEILMRQIQFATTIDSLAVGVTVSGNGISIDGCRFVDNASAQCLNWLLVTGDFARVVGCRCTQGTAGPAKAMYFNGADDLYLAHNDVRGNYSTAAIMLAGGGGTECLRFLVEGNVVQNLNGTANDCINNGNANNTGIIRFNSLDVPTDANTDWIVNTSSRVQLFENYGTNNVNETGKIVGTASV